MSSLSRRPLSPSRAEEPTAPGAPSGFPLGGFGPVPVSADGELDLDIPRLGGADGYVRDGRVILSLGLEGLGAVIERRLAVLSDGACGSFGSWTETTASALLPEGSCALYRVVLGGSVIYETDQPVRHDGTKPELAGIGIAEEGAREHEAGATLFVAANAENLKPVTISAEASDPESGLESASFHSNGVEVGVSSAPWSAELVPAPGTIDVTVTNSAGDSTTESVSVVADGQSPVGATISNPSVALPGEAVAITADPGSDGGAGLDLSSLVIERRLAVLSDVGCEAFGDWTPSGSADTALEGTCVQYRLRIQDNVANEAIVRSETTLEVADATAPSTSITAPEAGAELNGVTTVAAEASDSGAGVRSLAIQVASSEEEWTELGSAESAQLSVEWDTLLVDPGAYLLRSVAVDQAGNTAYSEVVSVVVAADEVVPVTAIVAPGPWETVSGTVTVSAQAEDVGSGVESVTVWIKAPCGGWIEVGSFRVQAARSPGTPPPSPLGSTRFARSRSTGAGTRACPRPSRSSSSPCRRPRNPRRSHRRRSLREEPAPSEDEDEVKSDDKGDDEAAAEEGATSDSGGDDSAQADDSAGAEDGDGLSVEDAEDVEKLDDYLRDDL